MMMRRSTATALVCACLVVLLFGADAPKAVYEKRILDSVLEEMRKAEEAATAKAAKETEQIRARQKTAAEAARKARKVLRFSFDAVKKPSSPHAFTSAFHFPVVAQYRTGTCWAFSTTSFLESEAARLTGKQVKLSELHTVYYEYLEKARRFVRERGKSELGQGSEANAVTRIFKQHGAVPLSVYTGLVGGVTRHDHKHMFGEIKDYLAYVRGRDVWNEEQILASVRVILDRYLGPPPPTFAYEGRTLTPKRFVSDVLKLNVDDYVVVMSTLSVPFYTMDEFKVPDNWWHSREYYNIPLVQWYACLKEAVRNGYTVSIGGDVSEPGYNGREDAAVVPPFDIPQEYINQDSRELRFYNKTTTDDHGVHLVGYATIAERDWFLIKDSSRAARHGKFEGYLFYRGDYVRLKMLTYMAHKDALKNVLAKRKK